MVPVEEKTKRIIPTPHLACSPHFYVSTGSREVAKRPYPIRLSLSADITSLNTYILDEISDIEGPLPDVFHIEQNIEIDESQPSAIYISIEYDILYLFPSSYHTEEWLNIGSPGFQDMLDEDQSLFRTIV